jgi:hypothetical protein
MKGPKLQMLIKTVLPMNALKFWTQFIQNFSLYSEEARVTNGFLNVRTGFSIKNYQGSFQLCFYIHMCFVSVLYSTSVCLEYKN